MFYLNRNSVSLNNEIDIYGCVFWTCSYDDSLNDYREISQFSEKKKYNIQIDYNFMKKLSEEDLKSIRQTASILKYPHITFVGNGENVRIVSRDISNDSVGDYVVTLSEPCTSEFQHTMLLDNLRVLPGSYKVSISPTIAHFVNQTFPIKYWIVMESV